MSTEAQPSSTDRFKFEDELMQQWQLAEDLDLLAEHLLEHDLDTDEAVNALVGLAAMHRMRCTKVTDIFEELVRSGQLT